MLTFSTPHISIIPTAFETSGEHVVQYITDNNGDRYFYASSGNYMWRELETGKPANFSAEEHDLLKAIFVRQIYGPYAI